LIFHGKKYYQAFIDCLSASHQRFGIEIQAYCLMGNHYHLLIKTPRGNLSRAMRHINGVYTQRYNRLKQTDGSLFRGRYKAILIESARYLTQVSRYIHRNPVELNKPLVDNLVDYCWSSYPAYLNKAVTQDWLIKEDVFGELGVLHPVPAYRRFVERGVDEETQRFYASNVWPACRGSEAFVDIAYANALSHSKEIAQGRRKQIISIEQIVAKVSEHVGCRKTEITHAKRGRRGPNLARWIALKLAHDFSGENLTTIARNFNVKHYSTVSRPIGRLNKFMKKDEEVVKLLKGISQDLTPKCNI